MWESHAEFLLHSIVVYMRNKGDYFSRELRSLEKIRLHLPPLDTPTRRIEWAVRDAKTGDAKADCSDDGSSSPKPLTSVGRENLIDGVGSTVACEMRHQSMCIESFQIIGGLEAYKDNIVEDIEVLSAYMREE